MSPDNEETAKKRAYLHRRVENDFTYHSCNPDQIVRMQIIRDHASVLAHAIVENCPLGREMENALTALETVSTTANAAIAREVAPNEH